jgi:geranylgeranyl diphosphate synthase type I
VSLSAFAGDSRKGASLAILAGDAASAMAQMMMGNLDTDLESQKKAEQIFAAMHFDVVYGQTLDIMEEVSAMEISVHKTASYTTVGPLSIGAAIAGARDADIRALARSAQSLGAAFQFRDDVISTFGDPTVTGKSVDADLLEGKRTVLIEEAKALSDKLQWKRIERVLGNPQASAKDIASARDALVQCGAEASCRAHIQALTEEFITAMQREYFGKNAKQFLVQLAEYLRGRDA